MDSMLDFVRVSVMKAVKLTVTFRLEKNVIKIQGHSKICEKKSFFHLGKIMGRSNPPSPQGGSRQSKFIKLKSVWQ